VRHTQPLTEPHGDSHLTGDDALHRCLTHGPLFYAVRAISIQYPHGVMLTMPHLAADNELLPRCPNPWLPTTPP